MSVVWVTSPVALRVPLGKRYACRVPEAVNPAMDCSPSPSGAPETTAPTGTTAGSRYALPGLRSTCTVAVSAAASRWMARLFGTSWMSTESVPVGGTVGSELASVRTSRRVEPDVARERSARRVNCAVVPSERTSVVVVHSCAV